MTARRAAGAAGAAAAIAALVFAGEPAAAEEMPGFPRANFGDIVLSDAQSAVAGIELEAPIGDYRNEPIAIYGPGSLFHEIGRPIGRLDVLTDVRTIPCTAFVVSERHIVTNHHCVPGLGANERLGSRRIDAVQLVMGYTEEGVADGARRYTVSPAPVEADARLDYAVLEVFGNPSAEFGTVTLSDRPLRARAPLWIIGHPMGEAQRVSREGCRAADPAVSARRLRHLCDTMPGNSGSPVLDAGERAVVALHHAGSRTQGVNYAVPMADILAVSRVLAAAVGEPDASAAAPAKQAAAGEDRPAPRQSVRDGSSADAATATAAAANAAQNAALRGEPDDAAAEEEFSAPHRAAARKVLQATAPYDGFRERLAIYIEETVDELATESGLPRGDLTAIVRREADRLAEDRDAHLDSLSSLWASRLDADALTVLADVFAGRPTPAASSAAIDTYTDVAQSILTRQIDASNRWERNLQLQLRLAARSAAQAATEGGGPPQVLRGKETP